MKKITKLMCGMCGALGLTLALTGCATISPIKNQNEEIIYNGNAAVMVDGYLYYGNAYADSSSFTSKNDYKTAAKTSYMARLNTNIDLAAKGIDFCPEKVEKVNGQVVNHDRSFTFVLGNYIYFATPNKEKAVSEGVSGHYFSHTTFYRSKLNGDGLKKIYSTTGEVSAVEVLKFNGQYYIVMLAGDKIIKIKIGNSVGSAEVLAEKVKQVALPKTYQATNKATSLDWNGEIYFTAGREGDVAGTYLKKININAKKDEEATVYSGIGQTITLSGRTKDVVFYTLAQTGVQPELYSLDTANISGQVVLGQAEDKVFTTDSITDLNLISTSAGEKGYIFTSANGKLVVASNAGTTKAVKLMNGENEVSGYKILAVKDRTIYVSTATDIFAADLSDAFANGADSVQCRNIVTMTKISDKGIAAFDGEFVYFYATLEKLEVEEGEEEVEEETDENLYLYRANVGGSGEDNYQLLSKTKIDSRYSK